MVNRAAAEAVTRDEFDQPAPAASPDTGPEPIPQSSVRPFEDLWPTWRSWSNRIFSLREDQLFMFLAVLIGIFSGVAVVCFRMAIEWVHLLSFGSSMFPPVLRVLIVPTVGGPLSCAPRDLCFSRRTRQRREPDEGSRLRLERLHSIQHCRRQIPDVRPRYRHWPIARSRRSLSANGRRNRFTSRPAA